MTESQRNLMMALLTQNKALGAQLDIAMDALSYYASTALPERANRALVEICKIGGM